MESGEKCKSVGGINEVLNVMVCAAVLCISVIASEVTVALCVYIIVRHHLGGFYVI